MTRGERPALWFEHDRTWAKQGWEVYVKGTKDRIKCPKCHSDFIVYNGNYFCDSWVHRRDKRTQLGEGECDWALPHPTITARDRKICDLIGIDYF